MRREFGFDFEGRYRLPALAFGITPSTARVAVTDRGATFATTSRRGLCASLIELAR